MRWLARQRAFLDFTLSCLWRRKGKNAALILVFALIVFLTASVMFTVRALRAEAAAALAGSPELIVQRMLAGRHELAPEAYAAKIKAVRGVTGVTPRLWGYYFNRAAGATYTVMAPADFAHADGEIVVGPQVARTWLSPVDGQYLFRTFTGTSEGFKPVASLPEDTELVSGDLILMSQAAFRRVFGVPAGLYTDLAVRVPNERELETVTEKIQRALPDTRPIQRRELLRTYAAVFDWRGGYVIVLLSGAALAFFIFAWDRATGLSAEERREIGILKALGWDTSDVLAMKLWEGLTISLTAFLLGMIAAYVHVFLAGAGLFAQALKGWSVLAPRLALTPEINATEVLSLFCLTVAPYAVITLIPAWRAATTDPDAVMRG